MNWKCVLLGIAVLGLGLAARGGRDAPTETAPVDDHIMGKREQKMPQVEFESFCRGQVRAVAKDSITVRGTDCERTSGVTDVQYPRPGESVETGNPLTFRYSDGPVLKGVRLVSNQDGYTLTHANGEVTVLRKADLLQERRFVVRGKLAAGDRPRHPPDRDNSYRLSDVKVGDQVWACYVRIDGVYYLEAVSILRRPGGRVPRAPWDEDDEKFWAQAGIKPPDHSEHHERMNALQDWEEKGIPIPAKFLSDGRAETNPPYPPVAPEPRPAKP